MQMCILRGERRAQTTRDQARVKRTVRYRPALASLRCLHSGDNKCLFCQIYFTYISCGTVTAH